MIGVLDAYGGPLAGRVVAALGPDARAAAPTEVTAGFDLLVVVLPLRARRVEDVTHSALSTLGSVAADPSMVASFRTGVVLVWAALAQDRVELSAPRVTTESAVTAWNAAPLLLGTAWARERARHPDDGSAARARSAALRRLVHAPTHHDVDGISLPDVCTQVGTLDPHHVHTLAVRLDGHRWSGARSVVAAVHLRAALT
ncbi:hypothetical protein GCM10010492_57580 [Saccharothrix mutabilis subsp. mutabilis]|uniref:Uncharacterized protein n=1 Tax=Saccharothrix mutabilis subsp. mutabilis TaxID=66855 RepID=A0ABN0UGP8_9PSEU